MELNTKDLVVLPAEGADRAPERIDHAWVVGPYTFQAVSRHGFPEPEYPPVMYRYHIDGKRVDSEMYASLDRALVSAVGARHLGPRSAAGPGVGTPADWFCVMIGLTEDEPQLGAWSRPDGSAPEGEMVALVDMEEPERATLANEDGTCRGSRAGWMTTESAVSGLTAKCRTCGQRASDLGARPELAGDRYLGWVPEHKAPVEER